MLSNPGGIILFVAFFWVLLATARWFLKRLARDMGLE